MKSLREMGGQLVLPSGLAQCCLLFDYQVIFKELHFHHLTKQLKLELLPNLNDSLGSHFFTLYIFSSIKQIMHACLAKYTGTHKQTSNYLA